MKYKILLLSIAFSALIVTAALAQSKPLDFNIKVYGGYGLLTPGGDFQTDFTSNATGAFNKIKYGLGNGVHAGAGVLLKLNETVSVGLDADYLTGNKTAPNNTNGDTVMGTFKSHHSVFSLIPNISVKLCSHPGYDIYNTIGVIAAVKTNVELDTYTSGNQGAQSDVKNTGSEIMKFKYGFNAGLQDAFGIQLHVAKNIMIFAQVTGYYLPADPKSSVSTATFYTNGVVSSVLIQNTTFNSAPHSSYSNTFQTNGNVTTVTGSSYPEPQRIFSIGLNAGLIIGLKK